MTIALLDKELETFEANKTELLVEAEGKYVLIHDGRVLGTYVSETDAIAEGYKMCGNVPFLVQLVSPLEVPANFVNSHFAL